MKHILTVGFLSLAIVANGQGECGGNLNLTDCTSTILQNTLVVNSTDTLNAGFWCAWVCTGDTLYLSGVENTVWVEAGGTVIIGEFGFAGILATEIGLKDGAKLIVDLDTVGSGPGPFSNVWYAPSANIEDPYGWFALNSCTSVVFDYGQAPVPGCDTSETVGIAERLEVAPRVHPNPATFELLVEVPAGRWNAQLTDPRGRSMIEMEGTGRLVIPVHGFPAGVYSLVLSNATERYVRKVVVQ